MRRLNLLVFLFLVFFITAGAVNAQTADFENLTLDQESYWNGSDGSGGFESGGAKFINNYYSDYLYWDGFAYSNVTDTITEGLDAQYNAITGSGVLGSKTYTVAWENIFLGNVPTISLNNEQIVSGAYFTNNNFAYYSMTNGDDSAKKFTDDDWFKLIITGIDSEGVETGTVEFMLADGTNIVNTWTWVDLSGLGIVKKLTFDLSSTDSGDFGMNTPAYFCMDNFNDSDNSDDDNDGYTENEGDCNDDNPNVNPGQTEICGDGIDQDCDGDDETCLPDSIDDDDSTCFINSVKLSFIFR